MAVCLEINKKIKETCPDPLNKELFVFPRELTYVTGNKIMFINSSSKIVKITFWTEDIEKNGVPTIYNFNFNKKVGEFEAGSVANFRIKTKSMINPVQLQEGEVYLNVNNIEGETCGNNPKNNINFGYQMGFRQTSNDELNLRGKSAVQENEINLQIIKNLTKILKPNIFLFNYWFEQNEDNPNNEIGITIRNKDKKKIFTK